MIHSVSNMNRNFLLSILFTISLFKGSPLAHASSFSTACAEAFGHNIAAATGTLIQNGQMTQMTYLGQELDFFRTTRSIQDLILDGGNPARTCLNDAISQKQKVLDAGTAEGRLVEELREAGSEAVGVDLALNEIQKKKPYFFQGDIRKMTFRSGTFDLSVSSFGVFHYGTTLEFRAEAMQELIRVTRQNGKILLIGVAGLAFSGRSTGSLNQLQAQFRGQLDLKSVHRGGEGWTLEWTKR